MSIKFRMAAWSDAAGRPNNEDCFVVSKNIAAQEWAFVTNETLSLGEKGALMVVCDGMGGMNAGEVASAVAVETVKEWFAPEKLTEGVVKSPESILHYIKKTIIAADKKIKEEARLDPEKEGMGSTIVLAWLLDKQVYAGWCGDSRAYRYNPANGIERLSHDHSYVQELVDAGKLKPELAMEHPHSNIITRSLGDIRQEAQPDTKAFPLCTNDIILLCTDGLCGIMQDAEIEAVIAENTNDMGACRDALLRISEQTGWTDNVTFTLSQIVSGGDKAEKKAKTAPKKGRAGVVCLVILVLLLLASGYFGRHYIQKTDENQENEENYAQVINRYQKAIDIDPNDVAAYNNMGLAYMEQQNYAQAISCFQKALDIAPNSVGAHHNMGNTYFKQKKYTEAISCYQKAIAIDPNFAVAYKYMGDAYAFGQQKNYTQAISCYQKAIAIDPNDAMKHHDLGIAYRLQKNYTQAISCYQKAIAIDPNFAQTYFYMSDAYRMQGNDTQAISCCQKAAQLGYTDAQKWLKDNGYSW